jgi:hypothetical protein
MAQLFNDYDPDDDVPEPSLPTTFSPDVAESVTGKSPGSPVEGAESSVDLTNPRPRNQHPRRSPCTTRCSPSPLPRPESTT